MYTRYSEHMTNMFVFDQQEYIKLASLHLYYVYVYYWLETLSLSLTNDREGHTIKPIGCQELVPVTWDRPGQMQNISTKIFIDSIALRNWIGHTHGLIYCSLHWYDSSRPMPIEVLFHLFFKAIYKHPSVQVHVSLYLLA